MTFAPSSKTIGEKLGLAPGVRVACFGAGDALAVLNLDNSLLIVEADAEVVLVGCRQMIDVDAHVPSAWKARRPGGRLWLLYLKGRADFSRNQLGAAVEALGLGLTWFRQVAVDDRWSAIWFKHRSEFQSLNR